MEKKEKTSFTIRMPTKLDEKLTDYISEVGMSKSAFICNVVYKALEDIKTTKSNKILKAK